MIRSDPRIAYIERSGMPLDDLLDHAGRRQRVLFFINLVGHGHAMQDARTIVLSTVPRK